MNIKHIFALSIVIGGLLPFGVAAQVRISEIMYDPPGTDTKREWVEVFNAGSAAVDLGTYFLYENNVFHKLVAHTTSVLGVGEYAIIADSIADVLLDYPAFSGVIFDSAFSLNNTGEALVIADATKATIHGFTYAVDMGGTDGHSLQINNDIAITAGPTFGSANKTQSEQLEEEVATSTSDTPGGSSGSGTGTSSHVQQEALSTYTPPVQFKLGAGRKRLVSIHAPIEFEAMVSKADLTPAFRWNFGDLETDSGRKVEHIYGYPGTYQVVLSGRLDGFEAVSRVEVQVREPVIVVEQATSSLTLINKDKTELNLGGFALHFLSGKRSIPSNSILEAGDGITIDRRPDEILQSIRYPDGTPYAVYDIETSHLEQLASYCGTKRLPVACRVARVRESLVQYENDTRVVYQ